MASVDGRFLTDYAEMHYGEAATRERLNRAAEHDESRYWVGPDGYRLSDRLWEQSRATRSSIEDVLRQSLAQGMSAVQTAVLLERHLNPEFRPKRDNQGNLIIDGRSGVITLAPWQEAWYSDLLPDRGYGSFPARRLARTEITRAHGNATEKAVAALGDYADIGWRLSPSHKDQDVCDDIANTDRYGLGPGVYPVEEVPRYPAHPMDLCRLEAVVTDDDDAIVAAVRAEFGLDDPVFDALDQATRLIPPQFDMSQLSRVPHQSLGDLFAAIVDAAGAVVDVADRVASGQSIAAAIGLNLGQIESVLGDLSSLNNLMPRIDAGLEQLVKQVDTATKTAARQRALRRKARVRALGKGEKPRPIRPASVQQSRVIDDAIVTDGLARTTWEVFENRVRLPDDLRRAIGIPVPAIRVGPSVHKKIGTTHQRDFEIYNRLNDELGNWTWAGPDPNDESAWVIYLDRGEREYKLVISVDRNGSYNIKTFFGTKNKENFANVRKRGLYVKRKGS